MTSDLATAARALIEVVVDIERAAEATTLGDDIDRDLLAWDFVEEANRRLAISRAMIEQRLAKRLPAKRHTVTGLGVLEVHRKTSRKPLDKEDLLRAVLDSRRHVPDPVSGEVTYAEETPLDKVLHVWDLARPRITALRERGFAVTTDDDGKPYDPLDEYLKTERGPLTLQVTR